MTKVASSSQEPDEKQIEAEKDAVRNEPRGKCKSRRGWKTVRTSRYSTIRKDKSNHSTWEKKMAAKQTKENVKLYEKSLKDALNAEKEAKRLRQVEHDKRRAENAKKSEVVQVIKNTAKIKRMKKKQLRLIEKR